MSRPGGIYRNPAMVRRHAEVLKERGLDLAVLEMPVGEFRMRDLNHPPRGRDTIRLKEDGIIRKVRNGSQTGVVWRRGINWRIFAEALNGDIPTD